MKKQVFLIDCDGICADFDSAFIKSFKELTGVQLKNSIFTKYDLASCLPRNKKLEKKLYKLTNKPGWCAKIKPYPGAIKAIKKLMRKYDLYFVTASSFHNPTWTHEREMWLRKHFGDNVQTIHTKHKHMVYGDFFLDDKTENVENWYFHNNGTVFIWDKLYNKDCDKNIQRVDSWEQLFGFLDLL